MSPRNPFEQWPDDAMGRVFALPPEVLRAIERGVRLIEVVGDAGCGKTTHLAAVGRLADEQGLPWAYRHLLRQPPGPPPAGGWWLLDEAQALPSGDLLEVVGAGLAAGSGVALGSHRRLTRQLDKLGPRLRLRLPRLRDPAGVEALLERWLAASGQGPAAAWFEPAAVKRLARLAAGVPRRLVRIGYELAEDRRPGRRITADEVSAAHDRLRRDAPLLFAPPSPGRAPCGRADSSSSSG